jgi:hypothetical protein
MIFRKILTSHAKFFLPYIQQYAVKSEKSLIKGLADNKKGITFALPNDGEGTCREGSEKFFEIEGIS